MDWCLASKGLRRYLQNAVSILLLGLVHTTAVAIPKSSELFDLDVRMF